MIGLLADVLLPMAIGAGRKPTNFGQALSTPLDQPVLYAPHELTEDLTRKPGAMRSPAVHTLPGGAGHQSSVAR